MTKLDLMIARVKALSPDQQEAVAAEIEMLLDVGASGGELTPAQEAELQRRLADENREYVPHEEVGAHFAAKYGP